MSFFEEFNEYLAQQDASQPDPLQNVRPSLRWLKDELATSAKSRIVEDDLFEPQNLHLTTDELSQKIVQEKQAAEVAKVKAAEAGQVQEAAQQLNIDAVIRSINEARSALGQTELLPERAQLQKPSDMQAIMGALGAMLFPQFAFDIASVPLQHQLGEQAKQQGLNDQAHAEQMRRAGIEAELAMTQGQAEQRAAELNFQAGLQREARQSEQNFQKEVIGINFQNALTMEASGFSRQLELLDKNQQHDLGMFFLANAMNPDVGPEVRNAAVAKLNSMGIEVTPVQGSSAAAGIASGLGIPVDQLAGMTGRELNQYVAMSLMMKDEKRKAEMFPLLKASQSQQNAMMAKELGFKDRMLQLQWDLGQASLRNTQSEIDNRTWMQSYNTEEQQRLRIGMVGTMYQGSIDAIKLQIGANTSIIEANKKVIEEATKKADTATVAKMNSENTKLLTQNDALMGALGSLNDQYLKLADDIRSQTGLDVQGTGNGESFLGTPYSWGGGSTTGPSKGIGKGAETTGFDCSGFTRAVANLDYGVKIPRTAKEQWSAGTGLFTISQGADQLGDAREGDFMYFRDGDSWHTGILVYHVEDNQLVPFIRHAPQTGAVVRDDRLADFLKTTKKQFLGVRRVMKDSVRPPR